MRYVSFFSGIEMASLAVEPLGWTPVAFAEVDPFASAVLAHHHPDVPNLGDVSKITDEQIESLGPIDLIIGGFPCFPRGTNVLTARGFVDIADVVVGDEVWTHRNRWRRVVKTFGPRLSETVRMKGHGQGNLVTTPNHRFYARSKSFRSTRVGGVATSVKTISEPSWVEAADMEAMFWAAPDMSCVASADVAPPSFVSDRGAFMWCLGYWLANGWTVEFSRAGRANSRASRVHWCAPHGRSDHVGERLASAGIACTKVVDRTATKFVKQSAELVEFLVPFGKYAAGKTVPVWILQASEMDRRRFLEGYLFGDGCEHHNGWRATTVSKNVAIGVRLLAISLGWSVALHHSEMPATTVIEGRTVNQRDQWNLVAVKGDKKGVSAFWQDGHVYGLVRSVEPTDRVEEVFDIEVEEDHSFVADGIVVHNCQDVSHAGRRKGLRNDDGTTTRSGLFFDAMRHVRTAHRRCGLRWLVLENVPGLYSNNAGRDFATVVGEVVGSTFDVPRAGWQDSGAAAGPRGMVEWCRLDAQWRGLAQRRERVFFVGDFGDWANRPPVLLERESLSGDPPACVAARQRPPAGPSRSPGRKSIWGQIASALWGGGAIGPTRVAPTIPARKLGGGGMGTEFEADGGLIPTPMTFNLRGREGGAQLEVDPDGLVNMRAASGGSSRSYVASVGVPLNDLDGCSHALNAKSTASGYMDTTVETFIGHRAGFDDVTAFSCKDDGRDASANLAPTMRSMNFDKSHANAGGQLAIAFHARQDPDSNTEVTHPLDTDGTSIGIAFDTTQITSGENRNNPQPGDPCHPLSATAHPPAYATQYEVRRLLPSECEKLMGVPVGYTNIPYRGKPAADGPRYKALGNGFAVPVIRWIAESIVAANAASRDRRWKT